MNETEIAYLAGLFDGEGTIRITQSYIPRLRRKHVTMGIKVGMQSKECVDRFAKLCGVKAKRHGDVFEVGIWQSKAALVLQQLLPYLSAKKQRAEFAIWFYDVCFGHRPRGAVKLTPYELRLRELGAQIMGLLNRRESMTFHGKSGEFGERLSPLVGEFLDMLTPSEASEGIGSEERVTTTQTSPNSNSAQERPDLLH